MFVEWFICAVTGPNVSTLFYFNVSHSREVDSIVHILQRENREVHIAAGDLMNIQTQSYPLKLMATT